MIHTSEYQEEAAELIAIEEEKAKQETAQKQQPQEELVIELNLEQVIVTRVIDGDTIELKDLRRVRLIGVNTPESTTLYVFHFHSYHRKGYLTKQFSTNADNDLYLIHPFESKFVFQII